MRSHACGMSSANSTPKGARKDDASAGPSPPRRDTTSGAKKASRVTSLLQRKTTQGLLDAPKDKPGASAGTEELPQLYLKGAGVRLRAFFRCVAPRSY